MAVSQGDAAVTVGYYRMVIDRKTDETFGAAIRPFLPKRSAMLHIAVAPNRKIMKENVLKNDVNWLTPQSSAISLCRDNDDAVKISVKLYDVADRLDD